MRAWLGLSVLGVICLFAYLDRQLLALLLQPMKAALALSDSQIGLLNGLFVAVFSALSAIPIGWAADRYDRRVVLAWCLFAWSAATIACGAVATFSQLSIAAIGMVMGESALIPIVYSMIPDLFDERRRTVANSTIYAILVLCFGLSLFLGGAVIKVVDSLRVDIGLLSHVPTWRVVFYIAGAMGPLAGLLLVLIPKASMSAAHTANTRRTSEFIQFLKHNGGVIFVTYLGLSTYVTAWLLLLLWSPAMLTRSFNIAPADAGFYLGFVITGGSLAGVLLSFLATRRWLASWGPGGALRLAQIGCLAALPATAALAFVHSLGMFLSSLTAVFAAIVFATALAPTTNQEIAPAKFRSTVIALYPLVALAAGAILPLVVGAISDSTPHNVNGLRNAVCLVTGVSLLIAIVILKMIQPAYGKLVAQNAESSNPVAAGITLK